MIEKRQILVGVVVLVFGITFLLTREYSSSSLGSDIRILTQYLNASVQESGRFVYKIPRKESDSIDYNILRHAGSIYSMATSEYSDEHSVGAAIDFLVEESSSPVEGLDNSLAVWSIPNFNSPKTKLQAKLGGTALAVVALSNLPNWHDYENELIRCGNFLAFMQKEDGSFYSKYYPETVGRSDEWESLYYPGEAALAFGYLFELTKDEIWLEHLESALHYLAVSRSESGEYIKDHWALIATAKYFGFKLSNEQKHRDIYLHAVEVTKTMLLQQITEDKINRFLVGGFSNNGAITPSATTLEGLIAISPFIKNSDIDKKDLYTAIELGIEFIRSGIIRSDELKGGVKRAIAQFDVDHPMATDHNRRVDEIRIDYVQHVLSALLGFRELKK
ncbi:hypothetical protein [Reinekea sp. G2M2-21]|uniref:hypothetical protein n=1 Tax=Reinekea sp. G2M2-21 TaxID=2788942 RepID=UPI0018A977CE|nr:hypothetical protein [Reinekea sp. G2M2-21]